MVTQDDKPDTGSTGTPRAIKWVLFASLAVNLLILGAIVGLWINEGPPRRDRGPESFAFIRALEPADRRALGREMRARDLRRAARGNAADAVALLRADPFDRSAFETFLAGEAARRDRVRTIGQAALAARIAAMTAAERQAYADRLDAALEKSRWR